MSRQRISWEETPLWRKIAIIVLSIFFSLLFIGLGARFVLNELYQGEQVCTVDSAKFNNSSGGSRGPSAYRSIHIESSDCGPMVITNTRYSEGMNDAALLEFLQANEGKKFVFVTKYVQFPDALSCWGIASTEPVE